MFIKRIESNAERFGGWFAGWFIVGYYFYLAYHVALYVHSNGGL